MSFDVNGKTVYYDPRPVIRRSRGVSGVVVVLVALAAFLPGLAIADGPLDPVRELFISGAVYWFTGSMGLLHKVVFQDASIFMAPFNNLLGGEGSLGIYSFVENLANSSVKPISATLFTLVMMTEWIKISQRADANQTMPFFKEIFTYMAFVIIYMYLIRNGFDFVGGLYDLVHKIDVGLAANHDFLNWKTEEVTKALQDKDADIGFYFGWLVYSFVSFGVIMLALAKASIAGWLLAIQVYVQAAFAPLAFTFFAYEGTRQWALGYLRHFLGLAATGVVLLILFYCFALIVPSVLNMDPAKPQFNLDAWDALGFLKLWACCGLLFQAIGQAGSWAHSIFGGGQ